MLHLASFFACGSPILKRLSISEIMDITDQNAVFVTTIIIILTNVYNCFVPVIVSL